MTACTKIRYISRRYARHAARQISRRYARLTAYRCTDCGFWHLTSQPAARKTFFRSKP